MPDVRALIESAQARGLRLFIDGDRVKVKAPQSLDEDVKSIIEKLREFKEEIKSVLTNADSIHPQDENLAPIRAWVVERVRGENGELRAALICSAILEDHLWVVWNRGFEPKDDLAIYYGDEMPLLKDKSLEDLREIHRVKLAFPRARVIQEGADQKIC